MHPDWARSLRDQCVSAAVPFFFKQWGAWYQGSDWGCSAESEGYKTYNFSDDTEMYRVGKKAAGRLLDGREWNEYPA